ncbi:MAG: SSU ribosomal protein S3p (S3e), partial [uncultured Rubrobacteraceae bacterium]
GSENTSGGLQARGQAQGREGRLQEQLVLGPRLRGALGRGPEDPGAHREEAQAGRDREHHDPEGRRAGRGRRGHPHGPARHRDRQGWVRGRRFAQRASELDQEEGPGQRARGLAPRAQRAACRRVHRGAARGPGGFPPDHEAGAPELHALRRRGREDPLRRSSRWYRDEPRGDHLRGAGSAAHAGRGHRVRLQGGQDSDGPDRREGLDQPRRPRGRAFGGSL